MPRFSKRVYLMRRKNDGMFKIGKTAYIKRRLSQLKKDNGPMEVLFVIPGYTETEREIHAMFTQYRQYRFSRHRLRNTDENVWFKHPTDWFEPSAEIVGWFLKHGDIWREPET